MSNQRNMRQWGRILTTLALLVIVAIVVVLLAGLMLAIVVG